MNEDDFWSLLEACNLIGQGNLSQQVELVRQKLEERSEQEILDFDHLLEEQMSKSFTRDLWAAAYIINGGCSDDGFDYFRAWLVAQGREIFHQALNNPESLTEAAAPGVELELLLYAAAKAYEAKTMKKFSRPAYPKAELTGEEWEEDEKVLQQKFPKLFAKFWHSSRLMKVSTVMDVDQAPAFPADSIGKNKIAAQDAAALYMQAVCLAMDETPENLAKSAALLARAADHGHADAQYLLGACFQDGHGVPQNYAEAAKRYRQAAAQGNADACGGLGALYHEGVGVDQSHEEAFKWYQKGAEGGSADSEFGLGVLYSDGLGVEQDLHKSLKWFRRAAQNGHERAALNVGLFFLNGTGVDPNATEAFTWFAEAAEAGSLQARYNLGVLYENGRGIGQDYAKAAEMYQLASNQGNANAMINLGMLYSNGKGVVQDYAKAAALYRRAADAGKLVALNNLAVLYQHGRGVPQDLAEAVRLYRQCAEAGIAIGQYNFGTMYHRGIGVAKDDNEALRWYHLAAAQNHAFAMNNIGDAYENGYGVARDYAEAANWYRKAAECGVSASHYSLGILYRDGLGVKQDYREAEKWLKAAVAHGFEKAGLVLQALYDGAHVGRPQPVTPQSNALPTGVIDRPQASPEQRVVSPLAAVQRALCLRALIRRSQIEAMLLGLRQNPMAAEKLDPGGLQTEARQINEWLKDEELWLAVSDKEKESFKPEKSAKTEDDTQNRP